MTNQKRLWTIVLFGFAILAIVLLAAGLSRVELLPGHRFLWDEATTASQMDSSVGAVELSAFWKFVIALVFWVLFPISLLYVILSPSARKRVLRDLIWILSLLLMLYLLVRALQQFVLFPKGSESQAPGSSLPIENPPAVAEFVSQPPLWLTFAISVLLVALVLGVIWYFWQRSRSVKAPLALLADEAHEALQSLRAGGDLKDAVMKCYREMGRILSEHRGLRRLRAMTPREFEEHLEDVGFRDDHVRKLTRLFEEVRYGARGSQEHQEREAVLCLEAIVQVYGGTA